MISIVVILFTSILLGRLLRTTRLVHFASFGVMPAIYLLLLLMGFEVGSNPHIMQNLSSLGLEALLITIGALTGTLWAARVVYYKFFHPPHARGEKETVSSGSIPKLT